MSAAAGTARARRPVGEHGGLPQIELAILSRQGGRDYNEDACGHWHSDDHLCCVVADGAGGHGGGDIAVEARGAAHHRAVRRRAAGRRPRRCTTCSSAPTRSVIRHQADGDAQRQMHSTVVALFIDLDSGQALWGHAGDSRLYVFRDGQVLAHTRDHSLVQSLVDAGVLTPEQMRTHPRRSELHSALGTDAEDLRVTHRRRAPWRLAPATCSCSAPTACGSTSRTREMCDSLTRPPTRRPGSRRSSRSCCAMPQRADKPRHDNFSGVGGLGRPAVALITRTETSMPNQVCTGAVHDTARFGVAPSTFNATPRPVLTSSMTAGVIIDNIPMVEHRRRSACARTPTNPAVAAATAAALGVLTPMPCVPVTAGALGARRAERADHQHPGARRHLQADLHVGRRDLASASPAR